MQTSHNSTGIDFLFLGWCTSCGTPLGLYLTHNWFQHRTGGCGDPESAVETEGRSWTGHTACMGAAVRSSWQGRTNEAMAANEQISWNRFLWVKNSVYSDQNPGHQPAFEPALQPGLLVNNPCSKWTVTAGQSALYSGSAEDQTLFSLEDTTACGCKVVEHMCWWWR